MPPAKDPPPPASPTAVKVAALVGWYVLVVMLLWRGEISPEKALVAGGVPLGFVLGLKVSELIRALVLKR